MSFFNQYLIENEEIIYECRAIPGKAKTNIEISIFSLIFSIFFISVLIISEAASPQLNTDFFVILIMGIIVLLISIYAIYDSLYGHNKRIEDEHYCITNYRVLIYKEKTKELKYGYLLKLKYIYTSHKKGNYGDLHIDVANPKSSHDAQTTQQNRESEFFSETNSQPRIDFYSIDNVDYVCSIAQEAQRKLMNSIDIAKKLG